MKQAMIFAAGLGTRLKPLTDTMPKALVPVGGRPLLDINIDQLSRAGYSRFVVNVHHFAEQIVEHVAPLTSPPVADEPELFARPAADVSPRQEHFPGTVLISDEREKLLDTGGGLKKAAPLFSDDDPILIHNVDILDNVDYEWFARQHEADEDAVLLVSRRKTKRYLLFDNSMRLMGWTNVETGEVKSPFPWVRMGLHSSLHAFAFSGIHSFSPRLFPLMDRFPDKFSIIDFYLSVCHRARIVGLVKDDLQVLDVGKLDALDKAEEFLRTL